LYLRCVQAWLKRLPFLARHHGAAFYRNDRSSDDRTFSE
jgi:hypothetical protein